VAHTRYVRQRRSHIRHAHHLLLQVQDERRGDERRGAERRGDEMRGDEMREEERR